MLPAAPGGPPGYRQRRDIKFWEEGRSSRNFFVKCSVKKILRYSGGYRLGCQQNLRCRWVRRPLQVLLALQFLRIPARLVFVTRAAYPLRPQRAIRKIGCRILASRWGQDVVVVFVRALAFARGGSTRRVGESSDGKFPPLPKTCLGSFFCAWRLEWLSHIL